MLKNELMSKSANNIKNALVLKRNMDSKECTKVNKDLTARYIDLIRQRGIRNQTFEKRVNSYGSDTEQQLKNILNNSSADICKDLGIIFDEMKSDIIATDFDKDERNENIEKSIDMFYEKSSKELNRLLESHKIPASKINELNYDIKHICENLKENISNNVKVYASKSDDSLIDFIKNEYKQYENKLLNKENMPKNSNNFINELKQSVKTEENILNESIKTKENIENKAEINKDDKTYI